MIAVKIPIGISMAITARDILSISSKKLAPKLKEAGSNIYGDYDRSNKALGEFHAIGLVFAMYTTWMNGIIANTIMKPG